VLSTEEEEKLDAIPLAEAVAAAPSGEGSGRYEIGESDLEKAEILGFADAPVKNVVPPLAPLLEPASDDEDEDDAEIEVVQSRKKKKKKRRDPDWEGNLSWQRDVLFVLLPLGFIWLVLTSISFFKPSVAWLTLTIGLLVYVIGKLGIIMKAAEEGLLQWLACLVPFYSPYYFITRWQHTLKPFLIASAGIVFVATGAAFKEYYGLINPISATLTVEAPERNILMRGGDPRMFGGHLEREPGAPDFRRGGDAGADGVYEQMLQEPNKAEALSWLQSDPKKHQLTRGTRAEAVRRVKELYTMGAKRVTIIGITVHPERNNEEEAIKVIVELPDKRSDRRRIFDWAAEIGGQKFPQEERKQKYITLDLG
jgi:hypothetical protein